MPTPHVNEVAAGTVAPASWANSVAGAVNQIGDALYPLGALAFPWASLTGVPAAFPPTVHTHDGTGGSGGAVAWGSIAGKPAAFVPINHAGAHYQGGVDQVTINWAQIAGVPAAFTPAAHKATHAFGTDPLYAWEIGAWAKASAGGGAQGNYVWVGTSDPAGGASEGDIWIRG